MKGRPACATPPPISTPPSPAEGRPGKSLVEILVVMVIILIVASILVGVGSAVWNAVWKLAKGN